MIDESQIIVYNGDVKKKLRESISFLLSPAKLVYGWIVFHIFWRLSLDDKIVFSCFSGKRYGDSPKYISILLHKEHPEIKQIWVYDKKKLVGTPKYVKQVKMHSLEMMRELATAKVWVDSHYQPRWVLKRKKGQFFIETWHGGIGFKKIGLDATDKIALMELINLRSTAKKVDIWVTDSDWSVNVHRKANNYKGDFLKCGLPRTDYLIGSRGEAKKKIHRFYNIPNNKKIVLYIPTMRYNPGKDDFAIDVDGVLGALHKNFGGEWVFVIRLHPVNQAIQKHIVGLYNNVYDGIKYDDVQDLIASADVCISDYSSAVFDSAILRHPTFCFAFDEDRYEEKERGFYQKPEDLPFPMAKNNTELITSITHFNKEKYEKELDEYFERVGMYDVNGSTKKIVKLIAERMDD